MCRATADAVGESRPRTVLELEDDAEVPVGNANSAKGKEHALAQGKKLTKRVERTLRCWSCRRCSYRSLAST